MKAFYDPTPAVLTSLDGPWCCSYSGGKDSTSLVTWIEWLRRAGWITVERPQLVSCDTTVEYPELQSVASDMMALLRKSGWECAVVEPKIHEKLYNRILGIGNTPIHPGIRSMRWCTRATKIDPMERWRKINSTGLTLTGLRLGESTMRDGKIKKRGCSAGGECGIPDPDERTFSPILHWTTCKVVDWLNGEVRSEVATAMKDIFAVTRRLVAIYEVVVTKGGFEFHEPDVKAARFGCIGCPAISATSQAPRSVISRNGIGSPLNELYDVWFEARQRVNRCWHPGGGNGGNGGYGPIRLETRRRLFDRVLDIQRRSGVTLVTQEDEAFIRQCWADKRYPRGWSEADELIEAPPAPSPLFDDAA